MNHFNLPKGLLDSVSKVMKETKVDHTPLQEKLIQGNKAAVKVTTDFDNAVASVVAEGRKKAAADQAKFFEASVAAHKGMGKSIAESIATKEEVTVDCIIAESAFEEIATRMKNVGVARRMQNVTEQKETIAQMTRTFAASFDQVVEANLSAELRSEQAIQEALQAVKTEIRTQMLNAVNVANAARVVDEASKIVTLLSVQEALKGKQKKIDANKNGKIDANDFEVLKTRHAKAGSDAVDEGKVLDTLKKVGKKALETLGHGSDEDLRKDLQKKMGAKPEQQTGKKSMAAYNEDVEQVDELKKSTLASYVDKAAQSAVGSGMAAGDKQSFTDNTRAKNFNSALKRLSNIKKATARLAKEEVELGEDMELTIEDFTLEELQDFMVSEEFQQLDELGRTTLTNYVTKVANQRGAQAGSRTAGLLAAAKKLRAMKKKPVVAEEIEQVEEDRSTGTVFDAKVAAEFKKKKPGESAGFDSKKTSTGTVYNRKPKKEDEEVKEGVELSVEEAERIAQIAKDLGL